jgi:hypothetical protein
MSIRRNTYFSDFLPNGWMVLQPGGSAERIEGWQTPEKEGKIRPIDVGRGNLD